MSIKCRLLIFNETSKYFKTFLHIHWNIFNRNAMNIQNVLLTSDIKLITMRNILYFMNSILCWSRYNWTKHQLQTCNMQTTKSTTFNLREMLSGKPRRLPLYGILFSQMKSAISDKNDFGKNNNKQYARRLLYDCDASFKIFKTLKLFGWDDESNPLI